MNTLCTCISLADTTKQDHSIFQKPFSESKVGKGKNASSTEHRRFVWEQIIWPLFLDINQSYFTVEQYHKKRDQVCDLYGMSPSRLSGGFISLVDKGVLQREGSHYSLHYRLIPYLRKRVVLEYGIALKGTYSKK